MIRILWGSQGGNAANLAQVISESLFAHELENEVQDMSVVEPEEIAAISKLIIVTSTYGDGEPPDNASEWMSYLKFAEELDLGHLQYAVLGLGDTYYPHFCQCGKDFDQFLGERGAKAIVPRLDCDLYYEEQYPEWLATLVTELKKSEKDLL